MNPHIVLVPLDFSAFSLRALDEAKKVAPGPTAIHIVSVIAPPTALYPGAVWKVDDEERHGHVRKRIAAELATRELDEATIHVHEAEGNAAYGIVAVADEIDADLIVIPSHGRTGIARLALGSVAERVVRMAHCPVLVLR